MVHGVRVEAGDVHRDKINVFSQLGLLDFALRATGFWCVVCVIKCYFESEKRFYSLIFLHSNLLRLLSALLSVLFLFPPSLISKGSDKTTG